MAFSQVVHILQQQFRAIKGVQIIYNELVSSVGVASSVARVPLSMQNPLASDLVIVLSEDGIKLSFDPTSQRLKVSRGPPQAEGLCSPLPSAAFQIIEVNDMTKVKLTYWYVRLSWTVLAVIARWATGVFVLTFTGCSTSH